MAIDLSNLTKWTDETSSDLIYNSILEGKTVKTVRVQSGVKHKMALNIIDNDLTAQAGACGFNASGDVSLDQRDIEVKDIKVEQKICLTDLEDYWASVKMNPGSYNTELPFEQVYSSIKRDQLGALIEDLVWRGDTGLTQSNLQYADGFKKLIQAEASDITTISTTATFSATNAIAIINEMVADLPENIAENDDLMIFCNYAQFRIYTQALITANLYHYSGDSTNFEIYIPGTNIRVKAVPGLKGVNEMYLTNASNLVIGTDLLNDYESFKIWYDESEDEIRFRAKFKLGTQIYFPENIVRYKKA
jgi:hypothetical protein